LKKSTTLERQRRAIAIYSTFHDDTILHNRFHSLQIFNFITMPSPSLEENKDMASLRGTSCHVNRWNPKGSKIPKALVVIFHGFLAHGFYPTVRYAAEFLSEAGYAVVAIDFPGHGRSQGMRGYLKSAKDLIEDGVAQTKYALTMYSDQPDLRLVLCGSSMGGAIALLVAHQLKQKDTELTLAKEPLVCLLAPMLQLNVSSLERMALQCLSMVAPTAQLIPSSATDPSKQYRDETKRQECETDDLTVSGAKLRVASALTCVDVALKVGEIMDSVTSPYLMLIADEDVVVNNEGSENLFQACPSKDKTKKNYPALHGLLCEPSPLFDEIQQDILTWLNERI
jgi:alpha-beta hydrolase superfamily lysophospholipase